MALLATDYLEAAAGRLPDKIAVVDETRQATYRELHAEAQSVGAALAGAGIFRQPVALWLGRTASSIAASQGVALSGNIYAPLDISAPPRRLRKMFMRLLPCAVIADGAQKAAAQEFLFQLPEKERPRLMLYEDIAYGQTCASGHSALREAAARRLPTDPLCILFTSGSTGMPKGVVVSHQLICNQIDVMTDIFGLDEHQVRAGQVPLYFTMGAYDDVYSVLATGGRLLLLSSAQLLFPRKLMKFLKEQGANACFWVPSMLNLAVSGKALELPSEELPPMRFVSFAGEQMPPDTVAAWQKAFPGARFVNRYGATELGPDTYAFLPDDAGALPALPIGTPIAGHELLLLDERGRRVTEPGDLGEIYVRGLTALGYWRDPERTAEAFVQNPLQDAYPERIYRTGDLARLQEDGSLVYVSRADDQIKHLGCRIELGEIEAAAMEVDGIGLAVCLYDAQKDELALFYTGGLAPARVMEELGAALPRYMWPTRLEPREALPQTASGKIDRQALKAGL